MRTPKGRAGQQAASARRSRRGWIGVIGVLLLAIFWLDAAVTQAPLHHLYYIPIVLAALTMDRYWAPATALAAIVLFHAARPSLLSGGYGESDLLQIGIFLIVGFVAARLTEDGRRLRRLAVTDDLTGLYNLRGLEARLATAIRACRQANAPLSLLVLDVDRLKDLNDTYGHRAGADAVRAVGGVIGANLPEAAFACRFGGDEFVVVLPGLDASPAIAAAHDLRRAVHARAIVLAGMRFPAGTLSISIGLACVTDLGSARSAHIDDAQAGEVLFDAADRALYLAKTGGRNRIAVA